LGTNKTIRRNFLKGAVGAGFVASAPGIALAAKEKPPEKKRPQEGDFLAFQKGEKKGEIVREEDVPMEGPVVMAFPMDPETGIIRKKSRLNQVLILRVEPSSLSDKTQVNAINGIVAYSSVCSHQGCVINTWNKEQQRIMCMCHGSGFDARNEGKAINGPAIRRLAALPLSSQDGVLVVREKFNGRVGAKRK
jgi:rieske iron-sulfur protein|tara:strand:+ start:888 stop:1463 length:576 start_codon:yes stop_codon:yes gene_type:complete